ncbi:winged helix-turn-helix domain-containing protein [Ensifer soli]|uniref:winged helix-turn-helix domain-containing protein n=1 Tax=Ciceribacter sp. sgz301302 TaxID=3342379 RepID=UPI0035B70647
MPSDDRPRVLLVDDDVVLAETLADYLCAHGFDARPAADGTEARCILAGFHPQAIVLDLHLGTESGLDIADGLAARFDDAAMPAILFLSGAASPFERVLGLETTADDFLEKPISPRELLARLRGLLRRSGHPAAPARLMRLGAVAIDLSAQKIVHADGGEDPLGPSEFALLKCFLDRPGHVLSRDDLLERAPASDGEAADRSIDRRIARLRRKLERDGGNVIEAVRGRGYRLVADEGPTQGGSAQGGSAQKG